MCIYNVKWNELWFVQKQDLGEQFWPGGVEKLKYIQFLFPNAQVLQRRQIPAWGPTDFGGLLTLGPANITLNELKGQGVHQKISSFQTSGNNLHNC